MMILVTGGAASGKSAHAERLLCARAVGRRLYLATMQPFGEEAVRRIARHRALREGKGFETVERFTALDKLSLDTHYDGILLEDLSNLLANELFAPEGAHERAFEAVLNGVLALRQSCGTLVVVTNEVFSDGVQYAPETMRFIELLGRLNEALAAEADVFCESVCGILCTWKGEAP